MGCREGQEGRQGLTSRLGGGLQVVSHTIAEARAGRTPNPDIMCNSMVKFGVFYDHVGKHFDRVVTGHYARAQREEGRRTCLLAHHAHAATLGRLTGPCYRCLFPAGFQPSGSSAPRTASRTRRTS